MSSHPPPSPSSQQQQQQEQTQVSTIYSSGGGGGGSVSTGTGGGGSSSTQFGDTTLTKVFVGGLAWETTREGLRHHFQQYGDILEAVVITDKATGRSKGYGFVTFRDPEGARRACADPTPVIDGRRANCNLASLGVRSRPGTPQGGRFRGGSPSPGRSPGRAQPFNTTASSPQHLPFSYQQAYPYPPYGYPPYQQEYLYPPNMVYNGPFYMTPPFPPALYGGGAGGGGGGGPPPPSLGSPSSSSTAAGGGGGGIYQSYPPFSPHQHYQHIPFPYAPFGSSHVPPHNLPSPSGLTPDQSPPPTTAGGGPQPQHGVASHQHQHAPSSTQ